MKFLILSLAILISANAFSDEICSVKFQEKLSSLNKKNPINEAELLYCSGEPTIKAYTGIEYVIPGVSDESSTEGIKIEKMYYSDVVLCDEQATFMNKEQKYVEAFNRKTVECRASKGACCK